MEKLTKINEFKEEINNGLERLSWDLHESLIESIKKLVLKACNNKDIDTLEEYVNSINDMLIADSRDLDFLKAVFEEGQLSITDIETCMHDFQSFIDCDLSNSFVFMHCTTLLDFATEELECDVANDRITQELAYMIDLNLYCDNLEHQGYTETSFGVLYTY